MKGMNNIMRDSVYKSMRLAIFESQDAGKITEAERDRLFETLEAQKDATELTEEKISKFFDELSEKYPDCSEDIEKLVKKLSKAEDSDKEEDKEEEEEDDEKDSDKDVNESVRELLEMIEKL